MKQQTTSSVLPKVSVTVNPELDKIETKGLFREKVEKMNEMLRKSRESKLKKG